MSPSVLTLRRQLCDQLAVIADGPNRFRVVTPFTFDDGDGLVIVLSNIGSRWLLSDEGHTFMHLSYLFSASELLTGARYQTIQTTLLAFDIENHDGVLLSYVEGSGFADAIFGFTQGLLRIADVALSARDRSESEFIQEFTQFVSDTVPPDRLVFQWSDRSSDPKGNYSVDCRIEARKPIFVYALLTDTRTRDATITQHHFIEHNISNISVGIFHDQETMPRKVVARFSDVVDKQFSSLGGNEALIARYLHEQMAA